MRLWHFTANRFAGPIRTNGLTRGGLLLRERPPTIDTSYRWLTVNPDWNQSWAEGSGRLPYKTNEVRLGIDVPAEHEHSILVWKEVGPILSSAYGLLSMFGDPENWRLFRGNLPPSWIVESENNPAYQNR